MHVWPFYKPHDHTRTSTGGQTGHVMCLAVAPDRDRLITGKSGANSPGITTGDLLY